MNLVTGFTSQVCFQFFGKKTTAEWLALLEAALRNAVNDELRVEQADAGEWLDHNLLQRPAGALTIVFHAIVWQYLPRATKDRMRQVLQREGDRTSNDRPIAWVRLEPLGAVADLRITLWPGGEEQRFLTSSYHGANVRTLEHGS